MSLLNSTGAQFGVLQVSDALSSMIANQVVILDYGEDLAYQQIKEDLDLYNQVISEELGEFVEFTDDTEKLYGEAGALEMMEADEYDVTDSQKIPMGIAVGLPLRRGEVKIGWTRDFIATTSVDQLQSNYDAAKLADLKRIQRNVRRALYYPISRPVYLPGTQTRNTAAYIDRLVAPQIPRPLYPLLNADGNPVPVGPNGETFDPSTHTHYMFSDWAGIGVDDADRNADLLALASNIVEHRVSGNLVIEINYADEAAIRALPDFVKRFDEGIIVGQNITYAGGRLNPYNYNNRVIGTFHGFDVWIKPWCLEGYIIAMALGSASMRPISWRTRKNGYNSDLTIVSKYRDVPLESDMMVRDGDCSVWMRHMAAIMDITHADAYHIPTSY